MSHINTKPVSLSNYCYDIAEMGKFVEGFTFSVSIEGQNEIYYLLPESHRTKDKFISPLPLILQPNESREFYTCFELPPLHDMNHPFWNNIYKNISSNNSNEIKCMINVSWNRNYTLTNEDELKLVSGEKINPQKLIPVLFSHEIVIKMRPKPEFDILKQWINNIPQDLLPPSQPIFTTHQEFPSSYWSSDAFLQFTQNIKLNNNNNFIEIEREKYNPCSFIRAGNRKPPANLCPSSIKGWKDLEKMFVPSTLRDEIQLTRMILEYFDSEENNHLQKRKDIIDWLKSLPEEQRVCMASYLEKSDLRRQIKNEKHKVYFIELLKDVYPMMTFYHQIMCFRFLNLPRPEKLTIATNTQELQKQIVESKKIRTPNEEDMRLKKQSIEPIDNYRVWKTINNGNEEYYVGKFIIFISSGPVNSVVLEDRKKNTFALDLSI